MYNEQRTIDDRFYVDCDIWILRNAHDIGVTLFQQNRPSLLFVQSQINFQL